MGNCVKCRSLPMEKRLGKIRGTEDKADMISIPSLMISGRKISWVLGEGLCR
jgi:hypothetical protein